MPVVTDIFYNSNESKLLNNPKYFVVPTLGVWCVKLYYFKILFEYHICKTHLS
eukprot:SAG31_NODE_9281_length_1305_cov_1.792703_2_plen_53_part_01